MLVKLVIPGARAAAPYEYFGRLVFPHLHMMMQDFIFRQRVP